MSKSWIPKVLAAMVVAVPALVVRLGQLAIPPALAVLLFGAAVVASAFLLAWAAETAEVDISASLSTAVLAFIAVLPEYAVDLYFSYTSGHRPEFAQYAAANMTGSNRLLIGIGWPVVVLVFWFAARRRQQKVTEVVLDPRRRIELGLLAMAGLYAFVIPLTRRISLLDSAFLLALFGVYLWRVSKQEKGEPDLVGVAEQMASLPRRTRIFMVILLFLAAAGFILASAAPFADALVEGGKQLGIDEFLLVQWLAPLASEAPELLVAGILASRLKGDDAIGTLLSSKVNQWTLLVGSLPLAHMVGGGGRTLPLDPRQTEEFALTAAQTVLGFAVLANLHFSVREAVVLLSLFLLQFAFPQRDVRLVLAAIYMLIGGVLLFRQRRQLPAIASEIFRRRSRSAGE
jgi:cation:H+ antiporter